MEKMKLKDLIFTIKPLSLNETLEYLTKKALEKDQKTFVVTLNPEILMLALGDKDYEKVLSSADLAVNDSVGILWAGKMFGKSLKGRIHGSDLVDKLSEAVAKEPITVGFLGGRENVAERTAKCLREKYPGLRVAFAIEERPIIQDDRKWKIEDSALKMEDRRLIHPQSSTLKNPPSTINHLSSIDKMSADILFVAFGSPKQEKWIYENLSKIDVRVAIGVGGAFDFVSGKVRRAPVWVRSLGLEWLFRLIIQPWRIKRQLALAKFVILVLEEKLI